MNIQGERILIFGDSLSHPGQDGAPYIFSVTDGSNRQSSAPGDLLASMLLEAGAEAAQIDARVGRSAVNFFSREDSAGLLAQDAAFAPTKVVVMLGTNDIGNDPQAEADAFTQLRDAYRGMGAEVWAVGPFTYVGKGDYLNAGADQVLGILASVFGADKVIDGRPLSINVQRTGDGIHFQPLAAAPTAANIANALASQNALAILPLLGWLAFGISSIVALAWGAKRFDSWREGRGLQGSDELEGLEGLTYDDFYRTGKQDCGNALSIDEFDMSAGNAEEIVEQFAEENLSDDSDWQEQQELGPEDIGSKEAFEAWRDGWKVCAKKSVERVLERQKTETDAYWLSTDTAGRDRVEQFPTFEAVLAELNKLHEGRVDSGDLTEPTFPEVTKNSDGSVTWHRWGGFSVGDQAMVRKRFSKIAPEADLYSTAVTIDPKTGDESGGVPIFLDKFGGKKKTLAAADRRDFRTSISELDAKSQIKREQKNLKKARAALIDAEQNQYSMGVKIAQDDIEMREAAIAHFSAWLTSKKPLGSTDDGDDYFAKMARESSRRQKLMHQALLKHQAVIVTGPRGRRSLLIQSGEMSNPAEGAHRVTEYLEDGPSGHTTRKTITELAKELSRDLHPVTIEPATEAEVMAWMSTPEFEEGTKRVLEVQRWNAGQRD